MSKDLEFDSKEKRNPHKYLLVAHVCWLNTKQRDGCPNLKRILGGFVIEVVCI